MKRSLRQWKKSTIKSSEERSYQLFLKKVEEYFTNPSSESATLLSPSELLEDFEKHIVQSATEVATTETKRRADWFTEAEQLLLDLISKRNEAFKLAMKKTSQENQQKPKETRQT